MQKLGNIPFHGRLGVSVVDYIICDQTRLQNVEYFIVKGPTYLSDHSQIAAWINTSQHLIQDNEETQLLKSLPTQFLWSTDSSTLFKTALNSSNIQSLVDKFLNNNFEKSELSRNRSSNIGSEYYSFNCE